MPKVIYHGQEARDKVLAGAETLYKAVKSTMSPKGRNVAIKRPYGHTVTHDGVTVAESIVLPDATEAIGAEIIREAAGKLNNEVGDGTTSVTVLTYHLLKGANKLVNSGMNPMMVKRRLEYYKGEVLKALDSLVIKLDDDKLLDVATISAGDKELGEIIGKLALEIGDGTITVEQGNGLETETEVIDGYSLNRGYISPHFITDKRKGEAILDKPVIVITNEKLKSAAQVATILKPLVDNDTKTILLVSDELSGEALSMLVQNHIRGNIQVCAIKSPAFGDGRLPALEDLAALTGGELMIDGSLKVGSAEKVIISKDKTTIIKGNGDVTERVEELKAKAKDLKGFEKEQVEARIANLKGRVGVIRVGGSTEAEIDEKKYRVDDAVAAVKAAQDGGIVAGGGVTFANLAYQYRDKSGVARVVYEALTAPLSVIADNGGFYSQDLVSRVLEYKGRGINVMKSDALVNMVEEGVIDPAKVTREVIQTAFSLAMTGITIDVLVVDVPDED